MTTLTIPVEEERFNTAVVRGRQPSREHDEQASAKLSTFNMPRSVEVSVQSNDVCRFQFEYPVTEHAEHRLRGVDRSSARVLLGQASGKILLIDLADATSQLSRGAPRIPLKSAAEQWAGELPAHVRFACVRNAEVIESFMLSMPPSIREQLLSALRECISGSSG